MDAAEYKHVVLGLIFLKHISDAFEANTLNSKYSATRALTLKTRMNIVRKASSGCQRKLDGTT